MSKKIYLLPALTRRIVSFAPKSRRRDDLSAAEKRTTPRGRSLRLESLEERQLLATLIVTSAGDTGTTAAGLELRTAVQNASAFDVIKFDPNVFNAATTISLTKGPLQITCSLTIDGTLGREKLEAITIDASGQTGNIFDVCNGYLSSQTVALKGLTLTGAKATAKVVGAGEIADNGGAIELRAGTNGSTLTVDSCVITGNSITSESDAYPANGGGICATGPKNTLIVKNSFVTANSASTTKDGSAASGGGIYAKVAGVTIQNTVVSENKVDSKSSSSAQVSGGGGIFCEAASAASTATITNATVVDNEVVSSNSSLMLGGGIYENVGVFTLSDSFVKGNSIDATATKASTTLNKIGGGGVACENGVATTGTVTITNTSIFENTASSVAAPTISGGGVYLNFGETGAAIHAKIGNSTVVDNKLTAAGESANVLRGGGIYYEAGSSANLTIHDSTIAANLMSTETADNKLGSALYVAPKAQSTTVVDVLNAVLTGTQTTAPRESTEFDVYRESTPTIRLYYCVYGNLSYDTGDPLKHGYDSPTAIVGGLSNQTSAQVFEGWDATTNAILLETDSSTAKLSSQSNAVVAGTFVASYKGATDSAASFYYYNRLADDSWWKAGETAASAYAFDEEEDDFGLPSTDVQKNVVTVVCETSQNDEFRLALTKDAVRGYYTGSYAPTPEIASTVVTTTNDSDNPYDNEISFREAVRYAVDGAKITFAETLTTPMFNLGAPITLGKNLTIQAGATFDGGATLADPTSGVRLFEIVAGKTVAFEGATFQNAFAVGSGGAILNRGTLLLNNAVFTGNASNGNGGAIANLNGSVMISQSASFTNNAANAGGAIYSYGTLANVVISTTGATTLATFVENKAIGAGGAIAIRSGSFSATNVSFIGNTSNKNATAYVAGNGPGGALYNAGVASVANGTFRSNEAVFGDGGAISNAPTGTLTLNGVEIGGATKEEANRAVFGGGIVNSGKLVFIGDSTLTRNEATANGGGIANSFETGSLFDGAGTIQINANVSVSNNVAQKYGGGLICVEGTTVQIGANGFFAFDENEVNSTAGQESADVALYLLDQPWPSTGVSEGVRLADYSPVAAAQNLSCSYDCATILPNALDSSIVYNYSFDVDGATRTFTSSEILSPSQLGLAPGAYYGTIELTDEFGESLGFEAAPTTLEIGAPAPAFDVATETLADGQILRLKIDATPTTGAVSDWKIAWGDGTETTSDLFSTSFIAVKRYEALGEYAVSLTADGTTFDLGTFVVAGSTDSNANGETIATQTVAIHEERIDVATTATTDWVFAPISNAKLDAFVFAAETLDAGESTAKINGEREKVFAERAVVLNDEVVETPFEFEAESGAKLLGQTDKALDELFNELFANQTTNDDWRLF